MKTAFSLLLVLFCLSGSLFAQNKPKKMDKVDSLAAALRAMIQTQHISQDSTTLKIDKSMLRDVGYGEQHSDDITGSVSSVRTNELQKSNYSNVFEYLQGRVPGVSVSRDGSSSSGYTIRIRGMNSITGNNEPLIVLDGSPLGNADALMYLNPRDIRSINVLKDAAASAIYGVRGSNGVILIRTRN